MISCKSGVTLINCKPEILLALIKVDPIFAEHGVDTVVTSTVWDYGKHVMHSDHYKGYAVDLRAKHLKPKAQVEVRDKIVKALGPNYYLLLHGRHIHYHLAFRPTYEGRNKWPFKP